MLGAGQEKAWAGDSGRSLQRTVRGGKGVGPAQRVHHDSRGEPVSDAVNLEQSIVGSCERTVGGEIQRPIFNCSSDRSESRGLGLRHT